MNDKVQSYTAYIKRSGHWQNLRARKLDSSPRCENCGSGFSLHVHHIRYRSFYDCDLEDLMTLCEKCHALVHVAKECLGWTVESAEETCGLIRQFTGLPMEEQKALRKEKRVKLKAGRITRKGRRKFRQDVLELLADYKRARIDTKSTKDLIRDLERLITQ